MNGLIDIGILQLIERSILVLLLGLGGLCLGVFVVRWRAVGQAREGALRARARLESELTDALGVLEAPGQPAVGEAGLGDRVLHVAHRNAHLCPEALEKVLETQESRARESLERGAPLLGTVGANAPFLGLTGTVLGILAAFSKMAETGGGGADVMSAIAGALIATAAGLLVAIPAVVLYNLLKARIKKTMSALAEIRQLVLARSLQATAGEPF
jgi:biopolymer transport protein ExbB/TolQ